MPLLWLALIFSGAEPATDLAAFPEWIRFYTATAGKYAIEVRDADGEFHPLTLQPMPILQYTNPERGFQNHGATYVWTREGRPLCIGSIWTVVPAEDPQHRWVSNELHSLATGPLRSKHEPRVSKRGPVPQWVTEQPGITWAAVPDAPEPAATASLRLIQMRRIAEQYTARLTSNLAEEKAGDLRLLTKPLYRYPADVPGATDGGLFAFVQGTDPEVLMLIEAMPSTSGNRWRIAFARFTHTTAVVLREGQVVWQCEKAEPYVGGNPHFLYWKIHAAEVEQP